VLEIGYGGGEHLARQAMENPHINYIGCEVFTGGIGKLLEKIDQQGIKNIRLYKDDAIKLLQALPAASLDEAYLLYPDPWPKFKHRKRRFVSPTTLKALARLIKPGGLLHVATDIEEYANWTLGQILRNDQFTWAPESPGCWHQPYSGWQPTRYETKARAQGRLKSFYFTFHK
jgi:tRNA (guanine-N7-)-methyltransferase